MISTTLVLRLERGLTDSKPQQPYDFFIFLAAIVTFIIEIKRLVSVVGFLGFAVLNCYPGAF